MKISKMNSIPMDEWQTPSYLFDILKTQYHFQFDCCATAENRKCALYSDDLESLDSIPIMAWMNPPYSIAWKMFEQYFSIVKKGVAIYRCDNMETALWQKVIFPNADWIFIPDRRISYEGIDGTGVRFPSALIGLGVNVPKDLSGTVVMVEPR